MRATALAAAAALTLGSCGKTRRSRRRDLRPRRVMVAKAMKGDAPVVIRTIGTVEPKSRVMVRPQVSGRVARLAAMEGTDVGVDRELHCA